MGTHCLTCEVLLTSENTYSRGKGLQSRCKKCQVKYQMNLREKKKTTKGHSMVETKVVGDGSIRLRYNPRRQLVDVRGPINVKEDAFFFVEVFDKKTWNYNEHKKEFCYRIARVSRTLWEEVTVDMQSMDEFKKEQEEAKELDNAIHDRKLARRRNRRQEGKS